MNETVNISCYQSVCDLDQNNILQKIHINSRADCSGWQNHVILHSDVLNSLVKSQGLAKTVWWTCVVWFSYTVWKFADTTDNHFDGNYIFSIWRKVFSALTEHQLRSKGQYLYLSTPWYFWATERSNFNGRLNEYTWMSSGYYLSSRFLETVF